MRNVNQVTKQFISQTHSTSVIISQSRSIHRLIASLVMPDMLTFLRENKRYFRMEIEFSHKGTSCNVFRQGLQNDYLSSNPHVEG